LDTWIDYAYKIENDALDDMSYIFQQYIEGEKKVQTEVRLTNYDVIVSNAILNFYTPPVVIRPAIEAFEDHRSTITNL